MSVVAVCQQCEVSSANGAGVCSGCELPLDDRSVNLSVALNQYLGERYKLVRRLGAGAFGEVFLARDTALDRDVAIKQVRLDTLSDPELAEDMKRRSLREAKMAAKLLHPNIVTVYDVVHVVTSTLIIMEYVDGITLESRLLEAGRLSYPEMLDLMSQTAAGLEHAHEHGIVHRDIKPANLMIDLRGRIRITDFGIARTEAGGDITATGSILGTPNYMSPEQARGQSQLDARADLFSLGCVIYECLSGEKPFQGSSAIEILMQIVNSAPPKLNCEGLRLHQDVDTVLNKALAQEADQRFSSPGTLMAALETIPAFPSPQKRTPPAADAQASTTTPMVITSRPRGSTTSFDIGLQGTLSHKGLGEIIRDIHCGGKTGILHVQKDDASKRLYFLDGPIVFANSDVESDRLGQFLMRSGVIDESTYEKTWRAMKQSGRRFGATLVELGNLDGHKMNSLVNQQIRDIIFSVFRWDAGHYGFEAIDRPVEEDIAIQLSTEEIILEGSRRMASEKTIPQLHRDHGADSPARREPTTVEQAPEPELAGRLSALLRRWVDVDWRASGDLRHERK